jgi:hypothetical protein
MIGKVYKITNTVTDDVYVGSTTSRLCTRWAIHKNELKFHPNRKVYQKLLEVGTVNCKIELLEDVSYKNKRELKAVEESYRKRVGANLNSYSCNRV